MSDVALDCFHPHPQLALDERMWCVWLALQNRKMSSCCMAFFTVLSCHTCSVQSVCAHARNDLTQKLLVKKQHKLGSQSPPQCGSSTPEYLSTVLGNTCTCRSCTPLLAQCLEFCGVIIICWADAAPMECAGDHEPSSCSLSSQIPSVIWLCSMAKTSRPPGESVKKSKWCKHRWLLRTASLFFICIFSNIFRVVVLAALPRHVWHRQFLAV